MICHGTFPPSMIQSGWWRKPASSHCKPVFHSYPLVMTTISMGRSTIFMGKSSISMVIFHSYGKLPEGTFQRSTPTGARWRVNERQERDMVVILINDPSRKVELHVETPHFYD